MIETVTVTHHAAKPEYQWELVVPEGPTVLLRAEHLREALETLGQERAEALQGEIEALPNGGSRSLDVDVTAEHLEKLRAMGVKTVQQQD